MEEPQVASKKVKAITFGIFSPKLVKKMAAVKVITPELYDREGYPVDGGLMDTRMGVIDPGLRCKTSGAKLKEDLGHFGYIELARPVMHVKFASVLLNILRASCRECSQPLMTKQKQTVALKRLEQVEAESGVTNKHVAVKELLASMKVTGKCPHCNAKQGKITIEKPTTYLEDEKRISPIEVRTRLEKIPDAALPLFGLNPHVMRPEWTVLTILAIPPVTMRPSITLETGERSEDDLTHKLGDIVRINQRLFENINAGAPEIIIEDLWDLLQYHITTFFDNNIAQLPPARHRSSQPLKTLCERIKSKEGRIRHNLAGKRVNFSARTVISPDPMISVNEVGVPKIIAKKLTVPERVTEWNFERLKQFVERGPNAYPGANYVIRPDGRRKKITDETKEALLEELQPGFLVERHLMDGDIALFNRQPSLHRMSMMCHKVRILPYRTFRLNPVVCHPYNADFDGDEMNLHIPQTEEARAEAKFLMMVQTQLISPRYGLSVIGCIQDAISGNYLLSQEEAIPRHVAIRMLAQAGVMEFKTLPNKNTVSGREIFSVLLPSDFNFSGHSRRSKKSGKEEKDPSYVIIKKGKLQQGILDRANLGEGSGLLLRNLHKQYGPDQTIDILEKIFRLGVHYLLYRGFTAGIADTDLDKDTWAQVNAELNKADEDVRILINDYAAGNLEALPGRTVEETLEIRILENLNNARNKAGSVVQQQGTGTSHTRIMADSGARGNIINLAQMSAVVGQQAMRGKRIDKGYYQRTLSCFRKGDLLPESRGFIRSGFRKGLNPKEFFFQAMTGRDSLMDTALRTPKSGYLYRRLANAMQDLKVEYDGSVRDSAGRIVQFAYGEDGIDVSKSESGTLNVKRALEVEQ